MELKIIEDWEVADGKGVRVLLKNADIAVDVLADLLTADDLAKLAARLEQKKLEAPVAPEQNPTT